MPDFPNAVTQLEETRTPNAAENVVAVATEHHLRRARNDQVVVQLLLERCESFRRLTSVKTNSTRLGAFTQVAA